MISRMTDVSSQTGDLQDLDGQPYSIVTLNYDTEMDNSNDWGPEDLLVTILDYPAKLFKCMSNDAIPSFARQADAFASGSVPNSRSRGVAIGDYNNDGYEDIFVTHNDSPMLLKWNTSTGKYVNEPMDILSFPGSQTSALVGFARKSACATWADFNQDGWLDLFIGRDSYNYPPLPGAVETMSSAGVQREYGELYINNEGCLEHDLDHYGDILASCFTASWIDIDRDGDQDLFVGDYWGDATNQTTKIYRNTGFAGNYALVEADSIANYGNLLGAEFADLNTDGYFDLVCASELGETNVSIYWNDANSQSGVMPQMSQANNEDIWLPADDEPLSGVSTGDYDLNGHLDILALPQRSTAIPQLLLNGLGSSSGVFANSAAFDLMEQGELLGATAHDWNNDGDLDLVLGRTPDDPDSMSTHFFYQNRNAANSNESLDQVKFVKVRLDREHFGNQAAIGSTVEILDSVGALIAPIQYVSGGDGRGGQRPRTLMFGLTDSTATSATVRVTWPEGRVQDFQLQSSDINSGMAVALTDTLMPDIDSSSMTYSKSAGIGYVDWTFIWESNVPLSDPGVVFTLDPDAASICDCSGSAPVGLTASSSNVEITTTTPSPGVFRYTMTWTQTWCCVPKCEYQFKAEGTYCDQELESGWSTVQSPKSCVSGL